MEKGLGRIHSQDFFLSPMCILRCCFKLQAPAILFLYTSHKNLSSDNFVVMSNITEQKYTDLIEMPCNYLIFPRPPLHWHFDWVNWMTTFNDEEARFKENSKCVPENVMLIKNLKFLTPFPKRVPILGTQGLISLEPSFWPQFLSPCLKLKFSSIILTNRYKVGNPLVGTSIRDPFRNTASGSAQIYF